MPGLYQAKAHLCGSFPAATGEEAMRKASNGLKGLLASVPDGETSWRCNFTIGLVQKVATQNPEIGPVFRTYNEKYDPLPVAESSPEEVQDLINKIASISLQTGYATEAIESYKVFLKLRQEGVIAPDMRFQVCLPGACSFAIFVKPQFQYFMEDLLFRTIQLDLIKIVAAIPAKDLAIQFDIAGDFIMIEAQKDPTYLETLRVDFHPPKEDAMERYVAQYVELVNLVPDTTTTVGLHICFGNINNKAVLEPKDMTVSVDLTNNIASRAKRHLNWVHYGCLSDWTESNPYAPLKGLKTDARVYLGLVYADDQEGAEKRVASAREHLADFGVAPPCGLARGPAAGAKSVLEVMTALSL